MKKAIAVQGNQSVVDKEGRWFAGTALKYGVSMNPICLAPPNGRFERILPTTALGRITNFVLYRIVEPILPGKSERVEVAEDTQTVGRDNELVWSAETSRRSLRRGERLGARVRRTGVELVRPTWGIRSRIMRSRASHSSRWMGQGASDLIKLNT
ncbi:MAG: hypothetical protein ACXW3G_08610 [Rhodoplanes sp.]